MTDFPLYKEELRQFVRMTLDEDIGRGDLTTQATIPQHSSLKAVMQTRENMVLAGMPLALEIIHTVDSAVRADIHVQDGVEIMAGSVILTLEGNARSILTAERSALNILQHLSGIATLTRAYVREIEHTGCILLDTRKTIPGYRKLAKYATRLGGGQKITACALMTAC